MCQNGTNQTDGTRESLRVWSHPSKKRPEVKKGLPDKCKNHPTSLQKSYVTSGRGDQGTSHDWA